MTVIKERRKEYYLTNDIQKHIIKFTTGREVVFMDRINNYKCIRGLNIRHHHYLLKFFEEYRFLEKDENIYISVAKYNYIPLFSYDLKMRSNETSNWFQERAEFQIIGYDLFLDFDNDNPKKDLEFISEVFHFCKLLLKNKICFMIHNSGTGYQVIIPSESISPYKKYKSWEYVRLLTVAFRDIFELKFLDLKGIGNPYKLKKCPYSLVANVVCYPFHDLMEINNFITYDDVLMSDLNGNNYFFNDCGQIKNIENLLIWLKSIGVKTDY